MMDDWNCSGPTEWKVRRRRRRLSEPEALVQGGDNQHRRQHTDKATFFKGGDNPIHDLTCKARHTRDCEQCYQELNQLVCEGVKPKFAMRGIYLEGSEAWVKKVLLSG
jgi:hypothetical protein